MTKHKFYFYCLLAVAFTISFPLKSHASGYAIICTLLAWLINADFRKKWLELKSKPLSFLFLSYYLVVVLGFFYSEDIKEAGFILEKNMALFALPLIILSGPQLDKKNIYSILTAFVLGCTATSLFALGKAVYLTLEHGNTLLSNGESYFYYHVLSGLAGVHTTYFAMYSSFCALLIGIHTFSKWPVLSRPAVLCRIFLGIYFILLMYLFSSRMAFLIFFFIISGFTLYYFYKKQMLGRGAIILAIAGAATLYAFSNLWHTRMRFYQLIHPNTEVWKGKETRNEILNRKVHLGCFFEAISSQNFFIGAGTGDWWNAVSPCYTKWDFHGLQKKYNAHNQYIEIFLRHGLLGTTIFMMSLLIPLWLAFRQKHRYYLIFLVLFALSCFTESMLESQHGVIFYSFLNAIFFYSTGINRRYPDSQESNIKK